MKTVEVQVAGASRQTVEILDVEEIGANHFRLVHSPGLVEGLAAGDEFRVTSDGFEVISRGGKLCVWVQYPHKGQVESAEAKDIQERIVRLGGGLDGTGYYSQVFTIPVAVGFSAIESLLDPAVAAIPGASWTYGNVYDPADGATPLNWWEQGA